MLLCAVNELVPGMVVGAAVPDPRVAGRQLIAPRVQINEDIIAGLQSRQVQHVWVHYAGTEDLDIAAGGDLSFMQTAMLVNLRDRFSRASMFTVSCAGAQEVRGMVMELITELMANRVYAGLASRLFATSDAMFVHSANVAYLSIILGLELQTYIQKERPRLEPAHARDLTPLGIGAIFHDIGKLRCAPETRRHHEAAHQNDTPPTYIDHPKVGREMLAASRAPAPALQAVLTHHQRYNGGGWPSAQLTGFNEPRPLKGGEIHIFSRIIAVANALDNLITRCARDERPPAEAMAQFASRMHDGWFDPVVHRAALRAVPPFPIGARVVLTDERPAVVVTPNRDNPCRPIVRPLDAPDPDDIIDLADEPTVRIAECAGYDVRGIDYAIPVLPEDNEEEQRAYYKRQWDKRRSA